MIIFSVKSRIKILFQNFLRSFTIVVQQQATLLKQK